MYDRITTAIWRTTTTTTEVISAGRPKCWSDFPKTNQQNLNKKIGQII